MRVGNPIAFTSFVLGYHGCDREIAEQVLSGERELKPSKNEYDWLGHGIYFWEHNPQRALEWAEELKAGKRGIKTPAIVGGIIDLGRCFNLLDSSNLRAVEFAYQNYKDIVALGGAQLLENKCSQKSSDSDLLLRYLDCAVINHAMELAEKDYPPFDSVRGVFMEGEPLYPNAGFRKKNHIQICVRNSKKILGYFRPS